MIDRPARDALAELLRQYEAGTISTDDFRRSAPSSRDLAISEVLGQA